MGRERDLGSTEGLNVLGGGKRCTKKMGIQTRGKEVVLPLEAAPFSPVKASQV